MYYLSPSILAADFNNLGRDVKLADEAGCDYVHFDVMDGLFVPSISFGMPVLQAVRKITDKVMDVHLMIQNPERYIADFARFGADIITVHIEATENLGNVIQMIRAQGLKASVAIKPSTPVEKLAPYLEQLDMVLVMTVQPGFGGQKYLEHCTEKVREVRALADEKKISLNIEVDGGINFDNVEDVIKAGANVIVAGSTVFNQDITEAVHKFKDIFARN